MGANIGTTITSLMLSVEIDFAIIFTAVGAVLPAGGQSAPPSSCGGQIAMGLGMLFLGMDMMSSAMEPLRDWKGFQRYDGLRRQPGGGRAGGRAA